MGRVEKNKSLSLCGFDINPRAVAAAVANVKRAGLSQYITIAQQSVENLQAINVSKPPLFVVNPPYGERLESQNRVEDLCMQLARKLKTEFSGSTLWLL